MSNQRLFRETDSRPITSIVRQRQLQLYGHVARYPKADPIYRVVSVRDRRLGGGLGDAHRTPGCGKSMPPAGSHLVWEGSLHGDMSGVGEATRPPVYALHD